jgi:hypothetical protein
MTYAEKIASLLSDMDSAMDLQSDSSAIDLNEITRALGCRYWEADPTRSGADIFTPRCPDAVHEAIVSHALLEIFRVNAACDNDDDISDSILDGLLINERWRLCLTNPKDACHFVEMLAIFYLGFNPHYSAHTVLKAAMLKDVHKLTQKWLGFDGAPSELTPTALPRLAFGEAWCGLFLTEGMPFSEIFYIVDAQMPPFMPGLLPAHLESTALPLPSMGA